jgi:uncharacterized membrane protein
MTAAADQAFNDRFEIARVQPDAPWRWLAGGWQDAMAARPTTLVIGAGFVAVSLMIALGLWSVGLAAAIPAAAGGFAVLGPLLATTLYELSRRLERGQSTTLQDALAPRLESAGQVALIGFALMIILMIWARMAALLYALFVGLEWKGAEAFFQFALQTGPGLTMLAIGSLIGAGLAFLAFAVTAVSIPLAMDRRIDAMTAMITSVRAIAKNKGAMFNWAWLIALATGAGLATGFIGLALVFPLLGCATWRAYRELIVDAP